MGGFGRVELVMIAGDNKQRSFALKQMKKSQIVETRQQQHIMSGTDGDKIKYCRNFPQSQTKCPKNFSVSAFCTFMSDLET